MQYLWELEKGFLKDILELFPEPKPHTNTVSTILKILMEKEFVVSLNTDTLIFLFISTTLHFYNTTDEHFRDMVLDILHPCQKKFHWEMHLSAIS